MNFSTYSPIRLSFAGVKSAGSILLAAWLGSTAVVYGQSLPARIIHKAEPANTFSLWSNQPVRLILDNETHGQAAFPAAAGQSAANPSSQKGNAQNAPLISGIQPTAFMPVDEENDPLAPLLLTSSRSIAITLDDIPSVNELSDPANHLIIFDFDPGLVIVEIEFDIRGLLNDHGAGSHSSSYASDARIRVSSSDNLVLFDYQPYSADGFAHPTALEPADLAGHYRDVFGLPWTVPASGGTLTFEFYEIFDDDSSHADGLYANQSYIRIVVIPEPAMLSLLTFSGAAFLTGHRSRSSKKFS